MTRDYRVFLSHRPFQTQSQQCLRLDRKFHRQFLEHGFTETVNNHRHGVFGGQSALLAKEQLVFADLGGRRFMFNLSGRLFDLDIGKVCAPHWSPISKESHWV